MRCILPYHEHNYFTRAIQMFRLTDKQNAAWAWLESAQVNPRIFSMEKSRKDLSRKQARPSLVLSWPIIVLLIWVS